ncbi:tripartite tricarboxylate transporter substrate-binding protein [Bradyrhizobium sp. CB1717]|uniref:tripartite tricarboxylate transporter substrate-binding protein n=1 Tax=Bradyrhizobium sp. CB1717 TaxID=3039154 RepID=UPI0024B18C20|nr:tripartite tricarboxylate transporter substrate-binding protein [Bradyrhizobium sp. CB1717]WFU23194.1 tripartite tricarboxylate transporter substrate-binding protein [Bradyrhizobium sp. CB1717]
MKAIAALLSLLAIEVACSFPARSAEYPIAPIKLLVPFPAGGLVDSVVRIVAARLGDELRQPLVIENKGGASGSIATAVAARSAADGYTIVAVTDSRATNPLAIKNLPYDSISDFSPIALVGSTPLILTVGKEVPVNTPPNLSRSQGVEEAVLFPAVPSVRAVPHILPVSYSSQ